MEINIVGVGGSVSDRFRTVAEEKSARIETLAPRAQRLDVKVTHRASGDQELESVRAVRPILYELLSAERDRAAEIVNDLLAESGPTPQLVRHGEWDWHLHGVANDAEPATRIVVDTAMAMIDVIRDDEMSRLGICADEGCEGIVLDLSRNRSKRFCSTACGNRNAVAAYRARRASA